MKVNKRRAPRMNKRTGAIIALCVALVLTLCVGYLGLNGMWLDSRGLDRLQSWIPQAGADKWPGAITLGPSLAGGEYGEYEAVIPEDGQVDAAMMDEAVHIIRNRLSQKGYADATVSRLGDTGLRVEVPSGQSTLLAMVSSQGKLEFLDSEDNVFMDGSVLASAQAVYDSNSNPAVSLSFDAEGTKIFYDMTAANEGKVLSINLDGSTIMSATLGEPLNGGVLLSGSFSVADATDLAMLLGSGMLPVSLTQSASGTFAGPLGSGALSSWVNGAFWALVLIMLVLVLRYRLGGLAASWALVVYIILLFLLLGALPGIPMSNAGMAGVLAGLCLMITASIIALERMKDEVLGGRPTAHAVRVGFEGAGKTILSMDLAVSLAAIGLLFVGTGYVQGFGALLLLSALMGLLCAYVILRWLLVRFVRICRTPGLYAPGAGSLQSAEITDGEAE